MTNDLAQRIVEALFDLSSEQGGLIKSQCVQRVREIIAFDQVNTTQPRSSLIQPERTNLVKPVVEYHGTSAHWDEINRIIAANLDLVTSSFTAGTTVGVCDGTGLEVFATGHASDCAVHNEPAMPVCLCDCGGVTVKGK